MLLRDRKDEAWNIVSRLHHSDDDPDEHFARAEFYQMHKQVDEERTTFKSESLFELFRKPSYRKRMFCGAFTFFSNESSGILVIYSKLILANN